MATTPCRAVAGNDTLNGGLGSDDIFTGNGADTVVFNSALGATNIDDVFDFSVVNDTINLENAVFIGLAAGPLAAAAFVIGAAAADAS